MKNQWEFINIEVNEEKSEKEIKELINSEIKCCIKDYESRKWGIKYKGEVKHTITNHNIKYKVYYVEVADLSTMEFMRNNLKIYSADEMNELCLTSAISKILNILEKKKIKENPIKDSNPSKKKKE